MSAGRRRGVLGAGLLGAGLLGAVALGSGVALTATSGWLIVRASERPVILTLLTAIVAVRTFGIARPVFRYWERLRSHDAALEELARARTELYAALVPLTPARLARHGRAAMLGGVVDDLGDVVEAQVRVTVPFVATGLAGLAAAALCAVVEPWAGAAVGALLVVAALGTTLAWALESRGQVELEQARAEVTRTSELVASQALDLQAVGAGAAAMGWLGGAHDRLARATARQSTGRAVAAGTIPLATALTTLACAAVGLGSEHSAPVVALLVLAPFALAEVFTPLPDAARALARSQAAGRRVRDLLALEPAVAAARGVPTTREPGGTQAPGATQGPITTQGAGTAQAPSAGGPSDGSVSPPHLRLRGVTASWDGTTPALAAVDLDVAPGQVVAVTGPSGCGKSTLLAVLARHLDPSTGQYFLDQADALSLPLEQVRALFAVVDDEPHVFASSVRENLRLAAPGATDEQVAAALGSAGLGDWLGTLPDGLDTRVGAGATGLSGGERARLSIARALLSGRPVLLLDEPVAHLDHPTATAVLGDLMAARDGRSVVVVSHRPEGLTGAHGIMELGGAAVAPARG